MDSFQLQPRNTLPTRETREAKKPLTDIATGKRAWVQDQDIEDFYSNVPCTD